MSSLKWVPAATPSSLATARADGVLTFRLRIRACFAARNTRLSGSAPRAAWSRGAWIWEGPRGEPAAPPHPAGRCCARRASAHAHPAAVPRPCPADQRPRQSGAQAAAAAQVPPTGRRRRGRTCAGSPRRRQRTAERSEGVLYARGRPAVCSRGLVDDLCRKYVHPGAALGQRRAAAVGGAGQICAAYALSLRALRRGGAPAALAHKLRRQGPPPRFASRRRARCGRGQAVRATKAPGTRRTGLGDGFADPARRRERAGGSSGRVLFAPGRPVVCKRGLLPAAHGLSGDAGRCLRLRTTDAAVWRAVGQFWTAVAAGGHRGRTVAAGGKHTRVCRRIWSAFLVSHQHFCALLAVCLADIRAASAGGGAGMAPWPVLMTMRLAAEMMEGALNAPGQPLSPECRSTIYLFAPARLLSSTGSVGLQPGAGLREAHASSGRHPGRVVPTVLPIIHGRSRLAADGNRHTRQVRLPRLQCHTTLLEGTFYRPRDGGACQICLAEAVQQRCLGTQVAS